MDLFLGLVFLGNGFKFNTGLSAETIYFLIFAVLLIYDI